MTALTPDTLPDRPAPDIPCACCGHTLDAKWQPPLLGWHDGMYLVSCPNRACDLFAFTFSDREYPPEKLFERYGVQR